MSKEAGEGMPSRVWMLSGSFEILEKRQQRFKGCRLKLKASSLVSRTCIRRQQVGANRELALHRTE